jgi:hypothetical protein
MKTQFLQPNFLIQVVRHDLSDIVCHSFMNTCCRPPLVWHEAAARGINLLETSIRPFRFAISELMIP